MTPPTPKPGSMVEIAERVERASGADRELDCLSAAAVDLRPEDGHQSAAEKLEQCGLSEMVRLSSRDQNMWSRWIPHYTASIDAAMSLVPGNAKVVIDNDGCHCRISKSDDPDWPWNGYAGLASTMPLAIVAASLRARAAAKGEGE